MIVFIEVEFAPFFRNNYDEFGFLVIFRRKLSPIKQWSLGGGGGGEGGN